jgi:hypothetical protein
MIIGRCVKCGGRGEYLRSPTGAWWAHEHHPDDDHDFEPREEVTDMAAEKPPIRITKQRAQAFLEAADRGIDEQIASLKENFGVTLTRDGELTFNDNEEYTLLADGADEEIAERKDSIMRAIDTLAIFRRRYG